MAVHRTKTMKVADGERLKLEQYPNISSTGSVKGMKKHYWGEDALCIRCGSYIYRVPEHIYNHTKAY